MTKELIEDQELGPEFDEVIQEKEESAPKDPEAPKTPQEPPAESPPEPTADPTDQDLIAALPEGPMRTLLQKRLDERTNYQAAMRQERQRRVLAARQGRVTTAPPEPVAPPAPKKEKIPVYSDESGEFFVKPEDIEPERDRTPATPEQLAMTREAEAEAAQRGFQIWRATHIAESDDPISTKVAIDEFFGARAIMDAGLGRYCQEHGVNPYSFNGDIKAILEVLDANGTLKEVNEKFQDIDPEMVLVAPTHDKLIDTAIKQRTDLVKSRRASSAAPVTTTNSPSRVPPRPLPDERPRAMGKLGQGAQPDKAGLNRWSHMTAAELAELSDEEFAEFEKDVRKAHEISAPQ